MDITDEEFDRTMRVNIRGAFLSLRAGMRAMTRNPGGAIVVTSSIMGLRGAQGGAAYVASKHAVVGLARTAAIEGGPIGIRVNAVAPGTVETPMLDRLSEGIAPGDAATGRELLRSATPVGRDATPGEVAAAVTWLISEEASHVNGTTLTVDGGRIAA